MSRCTTIHKARLWFPFSSGISQNKEEYNVTVFNRCDSYYTYVPLLLQYHKLYINTRLAV